MEFLFSHSTAIVATSFVLLLVFLFHLLYIPKLNTRKNRGAPQATGLWPIIGHLHLLGGSLLPHITLGNMAEKYRPLFTMKLGIHQTLVVSDREMAKEGFTTNDKVFATRPIALASEVMGYNYALFCLSSYGPYWRQICKTVVLELLTQRRLDMLSHVRVSEVKASVRDIFDLWMKNKESTDSKIVKIGMKHWLGSVILNVFLRIIMGKPILAHDEEGDRYHEVIRRFFELLGSFVVCDVIPYLRRLDLGGYEKAVKMTSKDMDTILTGRLEEHRRKNNFGLQMKTEQQDFMDAMISLLEGASEEDLHGVNRDTIIKATCQTILVGCVDSTIVTLIWAVCLLLTSPRVLEKAHHELGTLVGRERQVEESDVKNLVYLQAIIRETMHLYPAAPLSAPP